MYGLLSHLREFVSDLSVILSAKISMHYYKEIIWMQILSAVRCLPIRSSWDKTFEPLQIWQATYQVFSKMIYEQMVLCVFWAENWMNILDVKHAEKTNNIPSIFFIWQIWVIDLFLYKGGKQSDWSFMDGLLCEFRI